MAIPARQPERAGLHNGDKILTVGGKLYRGKGPARRGLDPAASPARW